VVVGRTEIILSGIDKAVQHQAHALCLDGKSRFIYFLVSEKSKVNNGVLRMANIIILRCGLGSNFDSFLLSWKLFKSNK